MKVLLVVCDLGRGGVQRGAKNFAHGFAQQGHDVVVLTTSRDSANESPVSGEYRTFDIESDPTQLSAEILDFAPDLVQIHAHLLRWEIVGWLRAAFPDAVLIEQSIWSRWQPSTSHVDLICHQSDWMGSVFRARTRFRRRRLQEYVIGKPVDIERFRESTDAEARDFRRRWDIPEDAVVIGRIGQPFEDKWHACLVSAFRDLATTHPDVFLLVVAPPPGIGAAIDALPPQLARRARFIEWLDGDGQLAAAYGAIDVFAHAARRGESFGFVLIESLASATPVVTLSTPYQDNAQLDWIAECGAGFVAGSPAEFTALLDRLVSDANLRRRLGLLGPPYVDRFSLERVCSQLLKNFDELRPPQGGRMPLVDRKDRGSGFDPVAQLSRAGLRPRPSVKFFLRVRPVLSWSYRGDRLWSELLRLWMERRVWPRECEAAAGLLGSADSGNAGGPSAPANPPPSVSVAMQGAARSAADSPSCDRLGVIIPTYHRDGALSATLHRLAEQTVPLTEVVVVDNASSPSCRDLCSGMAQTLPFQLSYISSVENGGPAGASSIGIHHFLAKGDHVDWIVRGDDDSPVLPDDFLAQVLDAAQQARGLTDRLGGVGGSGAVYNRRTGQLTKPPRSPSGLVEVDYLATNFYPLYAIDAVRVVGGFRDDLFFGFDEVEFGLRLRKAGFDLYRYEPPGAARQHSRPSFRMSPPTWRRYYSLRNQIVVAKSFGASGAATQLTALTLGKPLLHLIFSPRHAVTNLRLSWRAVVDAHSGRMGCTIAPTLVAGRLDERRSDG